MPTITGKILDKWHPLVAIRVSNAVPFLEGGEISASPASEKSTDTWALVDTGASKSVIDIALQRDLMLQQQATAPVLFPNMTQESYHPTYTCKIFFKEYTKHDSKLHQWIDWPEVLAIDLSGRRFKAVIGMDFLIHTELHIKENIVRIIYQD